MADVLQFRGNKKPVEFSQSMAEMADDVKGRVAGGICIVVTDDNVVHMICGPDLDGSLATFSKLQAILCSMYTGNLELK